MTQVTRTDRDGQGWWEPKDRFDRSSPTRRQILTALSLSATATLAGCLGDETDDGTESTDDDTSEADQPTETDENGEGDDENGTEDDGNGEENDEPDVPDSFDDPDALREYTREYLELITTGAFEDAAAWHDPELATQITAADLEQIWSREVGVEESPEFEAVAFLGTELGNEVFVVHAVVGEERYEFTVTYGEDGVLGILFSPIQEWSAPSYITPESIVETEISLETPIDCELGGTVTLPAEGTDLPGVVLVHGNGPQDRDVVTDPNRPFKELAQGLASNGIAVLRYDKRTYTCPVNLADATIDDIVTTDALRALETLRNHDRVDPESTFVAGHSFGGLLAPRIADQDGKLAGTVMLAPGPARSFATTIVDQQEHQLDLQGVTGDRREESLSEVEAEAERIRSLDIGPDEIVRFGGLEYHETLQEYDHAAVAAGLDVEQLLLQGGNDWQITVEDDLPIWEEALGNREDVTIRVYEELNHLFQESEPPLTPTEYAEPDTPVDERVIEAITGFVREDATDETEAGEETASRSEATAGDETAARDGSRRTAGVLGAVPALW